MKRQLYLMRTLMGVTLLVVSIAVRSAQLTPVLAQNRDQLDATMLVALKEFNVGSKPFVEQRDLAGLEQHARQLQLDWADRDAKSYAALMYNVATIFDKFLIPSPAAKALAIEFRELSILRCAETENPDEMRDLLYQSQDWNLVGRILPNEVVTMRERYADRMLTAWQRAEEAWDQIRERPLIRPVATNNLIRFVPLVPGGATTQPDEMPMPDSTTDS